MSDNIITEEKDINKNFKKINNVLNKNKIYNNLKKLKYINTLTT